MKRLVKLMHDSRHVHVFANYSFIFFSHFFAAMRILFDPCGNVYKLYFKKEASIVFNFAI